MSLSKSFLDRYVGYTNDLLYADKIMKIIGYGLGAMAGAGRRYMPDKDKIWTDAGRLSSHISMARMAYRLTNGIPQSLEAIKNSSWAGSEWKDKRIRKVYKAMAWFNLFYHIGEHWGWAGCFATETIKLPGGSAKFWAVTCYWWLLYVLFDIYGCLLKVKELKTKENILAKALEANPLDAKCQIALSAVKLGQFGIYWQLARLVLYLPNAYHWALEDGCMPEGLVQCLAFAEALVGTVSSFPR